jgi:hypothetical protein
MVNCMRKFLVVIIIVFCQVLFAQQNPEKKETIVFEKTINVVESGAPLNTKNTIQNSITDHENDQMNRDKLDHSMISPGQVTTPDAGVNLTSYLPTTAYSPYYSSGWGDKIVISNVRNTVNDASTITTTDSIFIDYAYINNGTDNITSQFYTYLYIDDVYKNYSYSSSLLSNYFAFRLDQNYGPLSSGSHTIKIVIDATSVITETNESDNTYSKSKTLTGTTPTITSFSPSSGIVGSTVTIYGTNFGSTQGTSTVQFGTTTGSVTSWSSTSISVTVPTLSSGNYTIYVTTTQGTTYATSQFTVTTATLSTPTLYSPYNNAASQSVPVTLSWSSVSGATSYNVKYCSSNRIYKNAVATSTNLILSSLAAGTTYNWYVQAVSSTGTSEWSSPFTFTTSNQQTVTQKTVASFPSSPTASTDYRLITYPSNTNPGVSSVISGEVGKDFRIFRDNGNISNFLDELNGTTSLKYGEGYWLVKKDNFVVNQLLSLPSVVSGNVSIPLKSNTWNIIGNPYLTSVKWADVVTQNGLASGDVLYTYNGVNGFALSTTMNPFVGYYYKNNSSALTLSIPYPFTAPVSLPKQSEIQTQIGIQYSSSINKDNSTFVGIDSRAKEGMDDFERGKPPLFSDRGSVWFDRPEWDLQHPRFASDIRPEFGEGQQWDFTIHHPSKSLGQITITGLDNLSSEYAAILIDKGSKIVTTITQNVPITISSSKEDKLYSLVIGKPAFLKNLKTTYVPLQYQVSQNYPNPFNPSTMINYQLPITNTVSLKVYDELGREVASLVNEVKEAGYYSTTFDASNLSSGMYFYTLCAGEFITSKKMLLMK